MLESIVLDNIKMRMMPVSRRITVFVMTFFMLPFLFPVYVRGAEYILYSVYLNWDGEAIYKRR